MHRKIKPTRLLCYSRKRSNISTKSAPVSFPVIAALEVLSIMDARDAQVKGLDRYLPSKLSKVLLTTLVTAMLALSQSYFLPDLIPVNKLTSSPIYILSLLVIVSSALIVELLVIINHSKHSRITSYNNLHPYMTFKWLSSNMEIKHYLFIACVFVFGLLCGLWLSHL
jgi:uncharacterized membrane protein